MLGICVSPLALSSFSFLSASDRLPICLSFLKSSNCSAFFDAALKEREPESSSFRLYSSPVCARARDSVGSHSVSRVFPCLSSALLSLSLSTPAVAASRSVGSATLFLYMRRRFAQSSRACMCAQTGSHTHIYARGLHKCECVKYVQFACSCARTCTYGGIIRRGSSVILKGNDFCWA